MRHAILFTALAALSLGCSTGARRPDSPATHYLNAMVGGTFERGGGGATVGGTYEHSFKDKFGLGAFGDVTLANDTVVALGPGVFFHPAPRWTLLGGLGVELDGDTAVFGRVGGWYDFPQKTFTIAPTAWIDLGLSDFVAFIGVNLGWRF
jgi:hypothetical protein